MKTSKWSNIRGFGFYPEKGKVYENVVYGEFRRCADNIFRSPFEGRVWADAMQSAANLIEGIRVGRARINGFK